MFALITYATWSPLHLLVIVHAHVCLGEICRMKWVFAFLSSHSLTTCSGCQRTCFAIYAPHMSGHLKRFRYCASQTVCTSCSCVCITIAESALTFLETSCKELLMPFPTDCAVLRQWSFQCCEMTATVAIHPHLSLPKLLATVNRVTSYHCRSLYTLLLLHHILHTSTGCDNDGRPPWCTHCCRTQLCTYV